MKIECYACNKVKEFPNWMPFAICDECKSSQPETLELEDIAATQAEHTQQLRAIETAIQLLTANIINLRTELLVIKSLVASQQENEEVSA